MQPQNYYTGRIKDLQVQLSAKLQKKSRLGWARFGVMVLAGATIYFLLPVGVLYVIITVLALLTLFIKLVFLDLDNNNSVKHTELLISVNEAELKALAGNYYQFGDGAEHTPHDHVYANDLDIFGH